MQGSLRRLLRLACLPLALAAMPAGASAATSANPAANRSLSPATETYCAQDPAGSACIASALADINAAHSAEGVPAMVLPSNFASMTVPVQLMNLANLERVDRGLVPVLGLSAALNRDAQAAAEQDRDPSPTNFYGDVATGNWAAGYDSALEAHFEWMYDDGLGSDNLDCTSADQSGCWGHREDILWPFTAPIAMGAGDASGQYGSSMTELFVGGDTQTSPGQPDAPVVQPTPPAGATPGTGTGTPPGSASASGHAASGGQPKRKPSIGPVLRAPHGVDVTVGCAGTLGGTCRLRVVLTVSGTLRNGRLVPTTGAARVTVAVASVVLASGHSHVVRLRISRAARRLLAVRHRLRASLAVALRGEPELTRVVTVRLVG